MIEQKQAFLHKPAERIIGDCFRTCIACILNMERDQVPHVYAEVFNYDDPKTTVAPQAHAALNKWLANYGMRFVEIPVECPDYETLRTYTSHYFSDLHIVLGCSSRNGGHSVVIQGKDYIWDPSIDNSGCVGPMEDGYYWIGLLVRATQERS